MSRDDGAVRSGGADEGALYLGVVALFFVFVPVVGDFVAVPTALVAAGLGLMGFLREDARGGAAPWKALAGAVAGLVSLFVAFITFAAMNTPG